MMQQQQQQMVQGVPVQAHIVRTQTPAEKIQGLKQLKLLDVGAITQEEFDAKKNQL